MKHWMRTTPWEKWGKGFLEVSILIALAGMAGKFALLLG